jgi:HB1, ASXL, restriction endonuclease HTH domain
MKRRKKARILAFVPPGLRVFPLDPLAQRASSVGMAERIMEHHDTISAAIDAVAEELQGIETALGHLQRQAQQLQQRATQLQEFMSIGRLLLGEDAAALQVLAPILPRHVSHKVTAANFAKQVLEEVGRPMRVQEIADYLTHRGLMRGKWTREVLRTAMRKHAEVFERVAEGVYVLKAWPSERKSVPDPGLPAFTLRSTKMPEQTMHELRSLVGRYFDGVDAEAYQKRVRS